MRLCLIQTVNLFLITGLTIPANSMLVPLQLATKIPPIIFQNQWAPSIRSLVFSPVDGRPHPVSGSMAISPFRIRIRFEHPIIRDRLGQCGLLWSHDQGTAKYCYNNYQLIILAIFAKFCEINQTRDNIL